MEKYSEDQKLALKITAGEPRAFKELVDRYQNHVLNICYRFILNREDAEDIAQEVFVEIYRAIGQFKGGSKLSTWIYRIAVNKSLDFIRKEKRKKRSSHKKESLDSREKRNIMITDDGDNPEQNLTIQQDLQVLRDAVNRLPENQRIVFTLSKYDGIGNKEIANIMGLTLSSVESLMHRAKANLRKKLFLHFKRDLKRGGKILLFIILVSLSRLLGEGPDFSKGKIFKKNAQENTKKNVKSIDRGIAKNGQI